ncbi:MAG: hypothetical protein U0745_15255 [Polyangia bacterium]
MSHVSNEPIFWDVRVQERRLRRGELTEKQLIEHLQSLPDVADKATASVPLEEPIERPPPRRPQVRITAAPVSRREMDDGDEYDGDLIDDEDDDDDDDLDDEDE